MPPRFPPRFATTQASPPAVTMTKASPPADNIQRVRDRRNRTSIELPPTYTASPSAVSPAREGHRSLITQALHFGLRAVQV